MSRGRPLTGLCAPLDGVDGEEIRVEGPSELSRWSEDLEDTSLTFHWKGLGGSGDETVVLDRSKAESVRDTLLVSQCSMVVCTVLSVVSLGPARWSS